MTNLFDLKNGFYWILLLVQGTGYAQVGASILTENTCSIHARINQYDPNRYNLLVTKQKVALTTDQTTLSFQNSQWQVNRTMKPLGKAGQYQLTVTFNCLSGRVDNASVSVDVDVSNWSTANYVLMPGAVYNGNRYPAIQMDYMPFYVDSTQMGPDKSILLSDQPRLNYRDGYSRIQERSGSMSIPGIGFHAPATGKGLWLCTKQGNAYGDYGIDIEEDKTRREATLSLTSPVVREVQRHWMCRMDVKPSTDTPVTFNAGDAITLSCLIDFFVCPTIQSLYDELTQLRTQHYPATEKRKILPFSAAFGIQEAKFNRENWRGAGYYAAGVTDRLSQDWQGGWTGGPITTLPLLAKGDERTRQRVISTFDWLFGQGLSPSGYYWDVIWRGKGQSNTQLKALGKNLHLVRKNADATYYLFKQFALMKSLNLPLKKSWIAGNLKALQAQIDTWNRYGQLGQYVNQLTGELAVGGSTSAGLLPASLCEAYKQTGNAEYLKTAEAIGDHFYRNYVQKGLTYGGPCDALQSFDSESAYGLLEGLTELYETTGNRQWLQRAEEMARQFATWIVAYDYQFPKNSTHGKLDIRSTGGVFANTQNKTAPGGICTHSGVALLKLYRSTQNPFYLNLLRDIAHALPQFMSFPGNEHPGFHEGWISERGNLNDWDMGIGETMAYSSWAETSLMLSIVELPGIYVNLETKQVFAIDHIQAALRPDGLLTLTNLTRFDAEVKVLAETKTQAAKPLGQNAFLNWKVVRVAPNSSTTTTLP